MYDRKAVKILFDTFWSPEGWISDPTITDRDEAYAKKHGVWFDSLKLSHDEIVKNTLFECARLTPRQVGNAFLASLSSRQLAYRSPLGSYAVNRHLPKHKAAGTDCRVCFESSRPRELQLSRFNFERMKWGGVLHQRPSYAWFDLRELGKMPPAEPTAQDRGLMRMILDLASSQKPNARPGDLAKQLSGKLPSNEWERRLLVDILGMAGVLQPGDQPGFLNGYVEVVDREEPPTTKNDWSFPVAWWRGSDGVSRKAVKVWFPDL